MGAALEIVALGLSAFLVINTVSAVLAQHVRQIGMMKTVGARRTLCDRAGGALIAAVAPVVSGARKSVREVLAYA